MAKKLKSPMIQCANFQWSLFLRNGVYYADGRRGAVNLGKPSLGTRSREEALENLALLDEQKAVELGKKPAALQKPPSELTIEQGWELYLAHGSRPEVMKGVSEATTKRYRPVRDHHVAFCKARGIATWQAFTKHWLEAHARELDKTKANRTVIFELTTIKSVSKWLVEEGLLPAECQLRYDLVKPQGTDAYCYSPAEVAAMLQQCTLKGLVWLFQLIMILAHTGMRIGEAVELRWSDIDAARGIRVADERFDSRKKKAGSARTTKGKRSRVIPIHPALAKMLAGMELHRDGRVLHAQRGGKLLQRNVLTTFIEQVIDPLKDRFPTPEGEIGFEHGRIHSFRHFFCSRALIGGASEGEVREWLGHTDSKMVEHYRHLRSEDAVRRIAGTNFLPAEQERPSDDADSETAPNLTVNEKAKQVSDEACGEMEGGPTDSSKGNKGPRFVPVLVPVTGTSTGSSV